MSRTNRWCFTHNNAEAGWRPHWDEETMNYLVWEVETAPSTGRKHVQGYVRMKQRRTLAMMKIFLDSSELHLEVAKGSEKQNREYCLKDSESILTEWQEHGTYDESISAHQGKRSDLDEAVTDIKSGKSLKDIAESHPKQWVKYHSGLRSLHQIISSSPPIRRTVTVTALWGTSGVGKSHRVRTAYPEAYIVLPGRDPFNSYSSQETIVFEEFDYKEWPIRRMNILLDVWSTELDSRYNNKKPWWNKVFLIANSSPTTWYLEETPEILQAFHRRISYTIEIKDRQQEILLI